MKALLILNPGSRSGAGSRLWRTWTDGLDAAGFEVEAVQTTSLDHAFSLARDAADHEAVIVAGGDGTINQALDGVMQSDAEALKLGILYSGTSPDFCTYHKIPTEPREALQVLERRESRRVDAVKIVLRDDNGDERTAHFGCSSNIGMGAAVARRANRWRKYLGDTCGTGLAVVSAIAQNPRVDLDLVIDGEEHSLRGVNNLFVLKNPYIASGLRLNFPLEPADGKLVVAAIHGKGRLGLLSVFPKLYSGEANNVPGLFVKECRSVEIRSAKPCEVEFDGDPRGWLPARIELLPSALDLIGST